MIDDQVKSRARCGGLKRPAHALHSWPGLFGVSMRFSPAAAAAVIRSLPVFWSWCVLVVSPTFTMAVPGFGWQGGSMRIHGWAGLDGWEWGGAARRASRELAATCAPAIRRPASLGFSHLPRPAAAPQQARGSAARAACARTHNPAPPPPKGGCLDRARARIGRTAPFL